MPPSSDLAARRKEAELAMEGDEHRRTREGREATIQKRRHEAQLAMESPGHRARRETIERVKREAIEGAATAAAERAKQEAAGKLTAATEAKIEAEKATRQAEVMTRLNATKEAAAEIRDLRGRPVHLGTIRTLKTDMAEAVSRGGSIAGAIIREGEMGNAHPASRPAGRRAMLTIILIFILLGALAGGGTLVYQKWFANSPLRPTDSTATSTPTSTSSVLHPFILSDHQTDIDVTNQTVATLISKVRAERAANQSPGTIEEVRFFRGGAPLPFRVWQNLLGLSLTDDLLRLLESNFMFGFYRGTTGSDGFIILKTKSAVPTYSQLLATEKSLPAVWNTLLGAPPGSGATTTPSFRDRVIQNLDARLLDGPGVASPVLYGFLDASTIIITQTPAAFLEVLNRFRAGR